jgi:hypothetical protein
MRQRATFSFAYTGTEPVSGADVRAHLLLNDSSQDTYLTALATMARDVLERMLHRSIVQRTVTMMLDSIPLTNDQSRDEWDGVRDGMISDYVGQRSYIELPYPAISSVTSVTSFSDSDVGTVFASSNYTPSINDPDRPGRITLRQGAVWPIGLRTSQAYQVIYVAGYANGAVPEAIKFAIKQLAAWAYSNRGDCSQESACACGSNKIAAAYMVMGSPA